MPQTCTPLHNEDPTIAELRACNQSRRVARSASRAAARGACRDKVTRGSGRRLRYFVSGWVRLPDGNPARVQGFRDLARKRLRLVNRQPGLRTRLSFARVAGGLPRQRREAAGTVVGVDTVGAWHRAGGRRRSAVRWRSASHYASHGIRVHPRSARVAEGL